ncbi:hypothetical protein OESDEN_20949 [Oesophagostomum dentatum]|nr:hypothetical protein OESDEN_20949 [Oesophagostomum dentatum]
MLKRNLIAAKQELDEAKEDQNRSDTPAKKRVTKKAQKLYDKELKALEQYFNVRLPDMKMEHMKEIEAILLELQSYHDWLASYCRPLTVYKVPQPANL